MKWGRVKAIIVRDLKLALREKTKLFWLFLFPLILLSGYTALFAPRSGSQGEIVINVAVVPEAGVTEELEKLLEYMRSPWNSSGGANFEVNVTVVEDLEKALKNLKKGYLDAVVFIPEDFIKEELMVRIYVLRGTPNSVKEQLVASYLYAFFSETANYAALGMLSSYINATAPPEARLYAAEFVNKAWKLASSPNIEMVDVVPGEEEVDVRSRIIGWMTLSVMFMNFMFGGILGGASAITSEIRRGFLHRLLSTRLRPSEYFMGMTVSWITLLTLATTPVAVLGFLAYGGSLAVEIASVEMMFILFLILVVEILTFSLGVLIGIFAKSPETASLIANLIVWATMIGGGFWIPKFMLPSFLRAFADVNILSVLFYAVTEIAVYGRGIENYLIPTVVAIVVSLILFLAASTAYLRYLPRLLEKAEVS